MDTRSDAAERTRRAHGPRVGGRAGYARVEGATSSILAQLRHMLRLDEDLSPFYAVARDDPKLAWAAAGAGRMLRGPTVFEDVVKDRLYSGNTWQ